MKALLPAALGIGLALASVGIERVGPRTVVGGEGFCGAGAVAPCTVEALGGGWPAAFLVDDPQVSVPNQLAFAEDDVRWAAFAIDVGVFAALVQAVRWMVRRRRRERST